MGFKKDVIELLSSVFGDSITSTIRDNYSENNPKELYDLAHSMLSRFMGTKNATKKLSKFG